MSVIGLPKGFAKPAYSYSNGGLGMIYLHSASLKFSHRLVQRKEIDQKVHEISITGTRGGTSIFNVYSCILLYVDLN